MKQSLYIGLFTGLVAVIACTVVQWPRQRTAPAPLLASFDGGASWSIASPPVEAPSPVKTWITGGRELIVPTTRPAQHASQLQRIIPQVHFKETKFVDAIEFLQQHADANLRVRWRSLEAKGIAKNLPVSLQLRNATVEEALREVLEEVIGHPQVDRSVQVGYRIEGNVVTIADAEHVPAQRVMRVYDIRDLLRAALSFSAQFPKGSLPALYFGGSVPYSGPPPVTEDNLTDGLADNILESIDRDSWINNGGYHGSLHYFAGHLIIVQDEANHYQIAQFLQALRQGPRTAPATQPAVPAGQ